MKHSDNTDKTSGIASCGCRQEHQCTTHAGPSHVSVPAPAAPVVVGGAWGVPALAAAEYMLRTNGRAGPSVVIIAASSGSECFTGIYEIY